MKAATAANKMGGHAWRVGASVTEKIDSLIDMSDVHTNIINESVNSIPLAPSHLANADTGTTGHYMSFRDITVLTDVTPALSPVSVTLPDGSLATSTHTAMLNLPSLPISRSWLKPGGKVQTRK